MFQKMIPVCSAVALAASVGVAATSADLSGMPVPLALPVVSTLSDYSLDVTPITGWNMTYLYEAYYAGSVKIPGYHYSIPSEMGGSVTSSQSSGRISFTSSVLSQNGSGSSDQYNSYTNASGPIVWNESQAAVGGTYCKIVAKLPDDVTSLSWSGNFDSQITISSYGKSIQTGFDIFAYVGEEPIANGEEYFATQPIDSVTFIFYPVSVSIGDNGSKYASVSASWTGYIDYSNIIVTLNPGAVGDIPLIDGDILGQDGLVHHFDEEISASFYIPQGFLGLATILRGESGASYALTVMNSSDLSSETVEYSNVLEAIVGGFNSIQSDIAKLRYVLASDEDLEIQEKVNDQKQGVLDNFTGDSPAAVGVGQIGDMAGVSGNVQGQLDTGVNFGTGFGAVTSSDNYSFWSSETQSQLNIATSGISTFSAVEDDGYVDFSQVNLEEFYKLIGKEG